MENTAYQIQHKVKSNAVVVLTELLSAISFMWTEHKAEL